MATSDDITSQPLRAVKLTARCARVLGESSLSTRGAQGAEHLQNQDSQILERDCLEDCVQWATNKCKKASRQRESAAIVRWLAEYRNHERNTKQHQLTLTVIERVFRQTSQRPACGTSMLHSKVFGKTNSTSDDNYFPRACPRVELAPQGIPTAQPTVNGIRSIRSVAWSRSHWCRDSSGGSKRQNLQFLLPASNFHNIIMVPPTFADSKARFDGSEAMILEDKRLNERCLHQKSAKSRLGRWSMMSPLTFSVETLQNRQRSEHVVLHHCRRNHLNTAHRNNKLQSHLFSGGVGSVPELARKLTHNRPFAGSTIASSRKDDLASCSSPVTLNFTIARCVEHSYFSCRSSPARARVFLTHLQVEMLTCARMPSASLQRQL